MRKLEKVAEDRFVEWVENHHPNFTAVKLNVGGRRGWPDRMVMGPCVFVLFIEFKREGEEPRPLQQYYIRYLKECGFNVEVCTTFEQARKAFYRSVPSKTLSKRGN